MISGLWTTVGPTAAVWGAPLILLLAAIGVYLTFLLRGLQFRRLLHSLALAVLQRDEPGGAGDISHFQALMTALGTTVGTSNLVGVAAALGAGGAGALFWMWVAGLVAMVTKYAEAVLGVRFRETDGRGEKSGGPMRYLENGIRWGGLGRALAVMFALFAAASAFGIGNGVQSRAIAQSVSSVSGLPPLVIGIVTAVLVGAVVLRGVCSIGRFAGAFVPLMIILYAGVSLWIVWLHADALPAALDAVMAGAFSGQAAAGGAIGHTIGQALRSGVATGLVSSEAGLGTGGIAAAAARTHEPVRQALISMSQVFVNTIVLCTLTGLVILTSGAALDGTEGLLPAQAAWSASFGSAGGWLVAVAVAVLSFTTIIGWAYYGERSLQFLLGDRAVVPFRLLFIATVVATSVAQLDVLWIFSVVLNGLMAFPNVIGLLLLSGIVVRETRSYFGRNRGQPSNRR